MKSSEKQTTLHDLVAESAARHPQQVCIIFDSGKDEPAEQQTVTYTQLYQKATELKLVFESLSLKERIVGVLLTDGPNIPSVLIGLLMSSCAFHPLNLEGLHYTATSLRKAGISWILVHSELVQKFSPVLTLLNGCFVPSETLSENGLQLFQIKHSSNPGLNPVKQNHLAYCITTSGTTSAPKVVYVPHACIVPNIIHLRKLFQLGISDKVLLTSPLTFDPSIVDIFCTLSSGACLVIVPSEIKRRPEKLLNIIHDRQAITVMQATPTLMRSFSPSKLQQSLLGHNTSLRVLALGGEMFPTSDILRSWLHTENSKTQFYNLYGITEMSCWASYQHVDIQKAIKGHPVPIGVALDETILKLVSTDNEGRDSDSDGEGDIWIGSKIRICFLDNEVHESHGETPWSLDKGKVEILWRSTGDRGKLLPDGSIICLCRKDDQVKRHGKRLNLDVLEMVCKEDTDVLDCCVLLDQSNLMVFLITNPPNYLKGNTKSVPADTSVTKDETSLVLLEDPIDFNWNMPNTSWTHLQRRLKDHIQDCLPSHYMPSVFVKIMGSFPRTMNGKLDKKFLITIGKTQMTVGFGRGISNVWTFSQELWMACLPYSCMHIHCSDNFISLGGDSLAAVRVISTAESILKCSLPTLFDRLINKDFSHFVEELQRNINMEQSDVQLTQISCELKDNINESLISGRLTSTSAHEPNQGKGNMVDVKQMVNINLTNLETKDLNKRLNKPLPSKSSKRKMSKLTDLNKSDEKRLIKDGSIVVGSISLSAQHDGNYETPLEVANCNSSNNELRFEHNTKHKLSFRNKHYSVSERSVRSPTLKRIASRGKIWQAETYDLKQESRNISECNTSNNCHSGIKSNVLEDVCGGCNDDPLGQIFKPALEMRSRWKFDTEKCVDASPLIVEQNGMLLVFIGSHSGQFSAINILTGDKVWSVSLPGRIESSACCSLCGTYVIVGCYDGGIYVFSVISGSKIWMYSTGDAVKCSPVVDDITGYVVCGSHDGFLYCLNLNTKECVWKQYMGGGSVFSSPVIDVSAHTVYAASLAGKILCIFADSGIVKWTYDLCKPVFSSLCLLADSVLVGCVDGKLYCINSMGQIEWTFLTQAPIFSTPIVHNSSVLVGSHDHHLYCLNSTGCLVWTFQTTSPVYSTSFASIFYYNLKNRREQCSDFQVGSNLPTQHSGHQLKSLSSIVITAATVGTLCVLDFNDGNILTEVQLPGEIFSSPVIVDQFVVVGCRDNFVYCLEIT